MCVDTNFTEIGVSRSNKQYDNVSSDKGLVSSSQQVIMGSNVGVNWCIYVSLGFNELRSVWNKTNYLCIRGDIMTFLHSKVIEI